MSKSRTMPPKLESEELAKNLNSLERKVYYLLVGNNRSLRTQSMIVKQYGLPKSSVCDIVHRLIRARVIKQMAGGKRLVLYKKGSNCIIVDEYVKLDLESGLYSHTSDDPVVTAPYTPETLSFIRTHLSGGWIDVDVVQEGELDKFPTDETVVTLFGKGEFKDGRRGIIALNGKTYINGAWTSIRYQKGKNTAYKQFGIAPTHILLTIDAIEKNREALLELFMGKITPFLNCLEKYGGWIFEKGSGGLYKFKSHAVPEFGFDGNVSAVLKDLLRGNEGVVGKDSIFIDHSDPAVAGFEAETRSVDVATSLMHLPETLQIQEELVQRLNQTVDRVSTLERDVRAIKDSQNPSGMEESE